MFAGDGTGMTDDGKLWRNGKLIPLRDLCEKFKELEDAEYNFSALKANKNGVYLIQAQGPTGQTLTKLLIPVRFKLRDFNNFARGWDDTNPRSPWTSCGVNRKKADGTDWPNSLIGVIIPGCTAELGSLLELVQYVPPAGGDTYVTLANQTIQGQQTLFDIQGIKATPASGCAIIVREKAHHENRSNPLNVHVFPPRVIKFQVYTASPSATAPPGFVATVDQIKTVLSTTYNEQANIKFEELQPDVIPVNNITGIFNPDGSLTDTNGKLLGAKIGQIYPAKHLKIMLINSLVTAKANDPDPVSVSDFKVDWAVVETSVPADVCSHETGHALNLRHSPVLAKAPDGGHPLMYFLQANTLWIRREDWKIANDEAIDARYGNGN